MSKTLSMNFLTAGGKKTAIKVSNVKDDITQAEVKSAMGIIVAKNIFSSKNGDLKSVDSAQLTDKTTTELQVK